MPKISSEAIKEKSKFKPKKYRAWDTDGNAKLAAETEVTTHIQTEGHEENRIVELNPDEISNWKLHDRKEFELGDIAALARDISENGQQQPIIVRESNNSEHKYEVIAGERRWRATKLAKINVKAIIRELTDAQAAVCQITENQNRNSLSPYSVGMNYMKLLEEKILSWAELEKVLGKSKSYIDALLSFASVPNEVWKAVGDMSSVSPNTAREIRSLCNKGQEHKKAILAIAADIRSGAGARKIRELTEKMLGLTSPKASESTGNAKTIKTNDGRHVFTWKKDSNKNPSITFPQDIRNNINFESLEKAILDEIEKQLELLKQKEVG